MVRLRGSPEDPPCLSGPALSPGPVPQLSAGKGRALSHSPQGPAEPFTFPSAHPQLCLPFSLSRQELTWPKAQHTYKHTFTQEQRPPDILTCPHILPYTHTHRTSLTLMLIFTPKHTHTNVHSWTHTNVSTLTQTHKTFPPTVI